MKMNNFVELNEKEMIEINGGGWGTVIVGGAITVLGIVAAVASCGTAIPAYGAICTGLSIAGGCATTTYGVMTEIKK